MQAIRVEAFGGPEVLRLQAVPDPEPAAGEVLIRVKAAGVNPAETYIRSGQYAKLPELPYTPGRDAAGTVAAVGAGVDAFQPGDHVYTAGTVTGAYAEFTVADSTSVHPLPDNASFEQGAALGIPYATAYRA
ncbi:MAG: alcohol dehydrogenase catalytic domain-containing protein, partial [Gammaproteobacteria bacterium]